MRNLFNQLQLIKLCFLLQMSILLLSGCGGGGSSSGTTGGGGNNPTELNGWSVNGPAIEHLHRISADPNGNVYAISEDLITLYLTKYDASGKRLWEQRWDQSQLVNLTSTGVSADNQGNVYTTGYSDEGTGSYEYYLAKFNESGELQWALQESNGGLVTQGFAVSSDNNGKVYVVGSDSNGYFIAQYDTEGQLLRTVESGSTNAQANAVSTDNKGGIYITGHNGNEAFFIAKYNESGNLLWINQSSSPGITGYGISADNNGRVYVTGGNYLNLDSSFISAYDSNNGNLLWTKDNQAESAVGIDISADNRGNVYAMDIMSDSAHNPTGYYLAKYDAQGTLWIQGTIQTTYASWGGVSVDNNGRVYVGGNAIRYFINQYVDD